MPRRAKPWYRKQTGWWMVYLNGEAVKLVQGPQDEAHRELAEEELLKLRRLQRQPSHVLGVRVVDIVELFLRHSYANLAPDTYRMHRYYCQHFANHCGELLVSEFRPFHVSQWLDWMRSAERVALAKESKAKERQDNPKKKHLLGSDPRAWGEQTAHNAHRVVKRIFSWAKNQTHLTANPLLDLRRPKPVGRRRALKQAEYEALVAAAKDPFRDLLIALWETGARPKELRDLERDKLLADRLVLSKHKTGQKTQELRVIYLSETAKVVFARQLGKHPKYVFVNSRGRPWTVNSIRLQLVRLRRKQGLANDVCAYLCRHGFGTRAVMKGIDVATVAQLMGHRGTEMVSKVYVHLAGEHEYLRFAIEKINAPPKPAATSEGSGAKTRQASLEAEKPSDASKTA